ncbi:MAG TPA: acetyltransferase [Chitinophagaceae bacterium]|nr:acetyltransferase [Chitinophagaceae bacterium]
MNIAIIGYSGHGFVAIDIFLSAGKKVEAYCDNEEKKFNPYGLNYLGKESDAIVIEQLRQFNYFIATGDNKIREKIYRNLSSVINQPINAIHSSAIISSSAVLQDGIMVAANATINPLAQIGKAVICNTGVVIEHECIVGDFVHIAPAAVLCGNVTIGKNSFIGANSVIRQGIIIGKNVTIGAGSVIIDNIPDNVMVAGNPHRILPSS